MKSFTSRSLEETDKIAADWLSGAARKHEGSMGGDPESAGAYVVGLSGHLGAGKTAFVKAVAKTLGIGEEVTSPTFVIMKIYEIPSSRPWKRLVHIDAYRLSEKNELEVLGFEKLVSGRDNLIMIEWPENVGLDKTGSVINGTISCRIQEGSFLYEIT